MGIRGRIALAISAVAAVAVVVFGLLVQFAPGVGLTQQDRARTHQSSLLDSARALYQRSGALTSGAHLDDEALPEPLEQVARTGRSATYITDGSAPRIWAAAPVDGKVLSISADFTRPGPWHAALDRAVLPACALTALLMAVAAFGAAQGLTQRLRLGAVAARRIIPGEPPPEPRPVAAAGQDEIAELNRSVHNLATLLAFRTAADRELTAGMAHELRTPVTGLVAAAELLPHPRAVEMVQERARRMRQLVEDLTEIARLDTGTEQAQPEPVDLAPWVRSIVARVSQQHGWGAEGDAVTVAVTGPSPAVHTDTHRLERILGIVLDNAARHGAPPIEVTVAGTRISVRDHGPGFPEEWLARGPRRFRTGAADRSAGQGLGLAIAVGHAQVLGARLSFAAAPDGGAETVLELPAR